ncbi:MAG: 1-acyl-sn-glycerol-3-phosphate acyltransferase [Haliscomenobacter sp.]|nr:1-acyl-sn-glycerol-3-phosphate acyltransferase [Haliscomenobacter sp.]MBK7478155.1 1-acyl-sn-glycerol-3-phosphate acyltransferase [Haliscomenobacter sp.]MBK8877864.1 1-acyl-sn-glycerol-3-phosphate acyltransferase [Haliscomenobacter sp.]
MAHLLAKWVYFKLWKWKLTGAFPSDIPKYIIIAAPHTSWWDLIMGFTVRAITGIKARYIGKDSLFKPPFGWFFRWTGGQPVDRSKSNNTVEAIVQLFQSREELIIALAPEGTRKKVSQLRSGFYYIALGASVPMVLVKLDFANKEVGVSEPLYPTGNKEEDFERILKFFRGVEGYRKGQGIYF